MRTNTFILFAISLYCIVTSSSIFAQNADYKVPASIEFAGVNIKITNDARKIIQDDVNVLAASRRGLDTKLERIVLYFPVVEAILAEEDIPNDFKYVVVQESSLLPDAVSTSNAVGYWQFKRETAFDFGLRIDSSIDERKNIHAATRAAALYLKRNNVVLNNWVSTLISYRLGLGGVRNILPTSWNYAKDISVDASTDWYILRCLAHKIVFESEIERFVSSTNLKFFDFKFGSDQSLSDIASNLEVDDILLKQHNQWLDTKRIPSDKEYIVAVPVVANQLPNLRAKVEATYAKNLAQNDVGFPVLKRLTPSLKNGRNDVILYEINGKKGIFAQEDDSFNSLAQKAQIKLNKLLEYNDLTEKDRVKPSLVYYLEKKDKKAVVPFHTVLDDQTLWKISQMYGIRLDHLLKYNRIEQVVKLQEGRILWLQEKRPKRVPVEYLKLNKPSEKAIIAAENIGKEKEQEPADTPIEKSNEMILDPIQPANEPSEIENTDARVVIFTSEKNNQSPEVIPEKKAETPKIPKEVYPKQALPKTEEIPKKEEVIIFKQETKNNTIETTSYHYVSAGQTYFSISRQYSISLSNLYEWNNLSANIPLEVGQKIIVRKGRTSKDTTTIYPDKTPKRSTDVQINYHTVQANETLYRIALKYNTSPDQLRLLNNLSDNTIEIGQRLRLK